MATEQFIEDSVIIACRAGVSPFTSHIYLDSQYAIDDCRLDVLLFDTASNSLLVVECKGGIATAGAVDQCMYYVQTLSAARERVWDSIRTSDHLAAVIPHTFSNWGVAGAVVAEGFDDSALAQRSRVVLCTASVSAADSPQFATPTNTATKAPPPKQHRLSRLFTQVDWANYIGVLSVRQVFEDLCRCYQEDADERSWVVVQAKYSYLWIRYRGEWVMWLQPNKRSLRVSVLDEDGHEGTLDAQVREASGRLTVEAWSDARQEHQPAELRAAVLKRIAAIQSFY
ncbi:MAG: hypothetical protein ACYTEZ_13110 [Planctomycetota bacterium]